VHSILLSIRVAALVGQVAAITTAYVIFAGDLAVWPLLGVSLTYGAWTVLSELQGRRSAGDVDDRISLEITLDLLAIAALMYFAGGWTNPFASIYLVPLAFAASVLSPLRAILLGLLAFGLYSTTMFYYQPLPSVEQRFGGDFNLHVLGMWISFGIAATVLIGSVSLERAAFVAERNALAQARESRMRDEQLLLIGVHAASTAHEIGTPLSTARMLVTELAEFADKPDRTLVQLREQLDYATDRLHELVGLADADRVEPIRPSAFVERLADRFQTLHPEVSLETRIELSPVGLIDDPRLLEGAVLNLLSNAATASRANDREVVEFACRVERQELIFDVRDYGRGIEEDFEPGKKGVHSHEGLGVGLVISSSTFERYRAEARYENCDPGTRVVVRLPLSALVDGKSHG